MSGTLRLAVVGLLGLAATLAIGCLEERILHDEASSECVCPDPDATCIDGLCVEVGECNRTTCAAEYECNAPLAFEHMKLGCLCSPEPARWVECAPRCESEDDCGHSFRCRQPDGLCIYEHRCLTSDACDAGSLCAFDYDDSDPIYDFKADIPRTCRRPGPGKRGEGCNDHADCLSGLCSIEQTCKEAVRCRANEDCDVAERCVTDQCRPADGVCEYCDLPGHFCDEYSGACERRCATTADCGQTDCVLDSVSGLICSDVPHLCNDDEFRPGPDGGESSEVPLCLRHRTCWIGRDCSTGYDCISIADRVTGYCGRSP